MRVIGFHIVVLALAAWFFPQAAHAGDDSPGALTQKFLSAGKLNDGEKFLANHLKKHPADGEARFGLGAIQFFQAVEKLGQSLYNFGLENRSNFMQNQIPFARLPLPKNPKPQKVSYARLRDVFERFRTDLEKAEKTLSQVQDTKVKLRLDLDEIRLDLNGDGTADAEETLQKFYTQYLGNLKVKQVTFDLADVHWLRGYCHLLMAMDEVILAYDWQPLFQNVGHLFFAKVDTPFKHTDKYEWILDEITFIHLLNFPVKEPQRMKKALGHLESVIQQSRLSWKKIQTEMDDDREWIPGPKQTGAININVTEDMVKGWHEFLDEAEAMLAGKKLVPHWRIRDGRGINLRKVFTHPARFDLVLYVHGSGVYPFLEKGPITDPNLWNRLQTVFRGQFIGFAFWFN